MSKKSQTLKTLQFKICGACREEVNVEDFYQRKTKSGEKRPGTYCKKCSNEKSNVSRQRPSYKNKAKQRYKKQKVADPLKKKLQNSLSSMRSKTKNRSFDCNFTQETLRDWWVNTDDICAICGMDEIDALSLARNIYNYSGEDKRLIRFDFSETQVSSDFLEIDRIDSDLGYTQNNVQKVCRCCNSYKGHNESLPIELVANNTLTVKDLVKNMMDNSPSLFSPNERKEQKKAKVIKVPLSTHTTLQKMKGILKTGSMYKAIDKMAELAELHLNE